MKFAKQVARSAGGVCAAGLTVSAVLAAPALAQNKMVFNSLADLDSCANKNAYDTGVCLVPLQAYAKAHPKEVASLIMDTCHTAQPVSPDEQLLLDIALSILGADPQRFAQYEQQTRDEHAHAHVPDAIFVARRRDILNGFLARQHIYPTAWFQQTLEARARENLRERYLR